MQVAEHVHRASIRDIVQYHGTMLATTETVDDDDDQEQSISTLNASSSSSSLLPSKGKDVSRSFRNNENSVIKDDTDGGKEGVTEVVAEIDDHDNKSTRKEEEIEDGDDNDDDDDEEEEEEEEEKEREKEKEKGKEKEEGDGGKKEIKGGYIGTKSPLKIKLVDQTSIRTGQDSPEVIHAREKAAKEQKKLRILMDAVETERVRASAAVGKQKQVKDILISKMDKVCIERSTEEPEPLSSSSSMFKSPRNGQQSPLDTPASPLVSSPSSTNSHVSSGTGSSYTLSYSPRRPGRGSAEDVEAEIERMKEEKRLAEIVAVITRRRVAEENKKNNDDNR